MLWWLSPREEWDYALHDAVEITCKNGATTESQGAGVKGVYVEDCVCII